MSLKKGARTLSVFLLILSFVASAKSACYGTPANGRIEDAVPLPPEGKNFRAHSRLGVSLGRTYAHERVVRAVEAAYAQTAKSMPTRTFVYGETGLKNGGPFKPHKTHQNGLSVDFMVPVLNTKGRSVPLPGHAGNRYGYDIEFDARAQHDDLRIDFEAMAEHLYQLHRTARASGAAIDRVIFDPDYLPKLYATRRGPYLRRNLHFVRGKVWWRHDEHYHVDFSVPCRKFLVPHLK